MERRAFLKILATVPVAAIALKFPNAELSQADTIAALYRTYLGREASQAEIMSWIGDHDFAASVIVSSPEARYKDITPPGFD